MSRPAGASAPQPEWLCVVVFALLTFENRSYQPDDILRYTIAAVVFTIFYYLLWEIWLTYMERKIWKGMGKQK